MQLLRFRDCGPRFADLLGVPLGVAGDDQQHFEAVPRSEARMFGGERIKIRSALLGETDGARPDGVEMFESLSHTGETASRPDRLRSYRSLLTIRDQRRKLRFPLFVRHRRGCPLGLLQPSQKSL